MLPAWILYQLVVYNQVIFTDGPEIVLVTEFLVEERSYPVIIFRCLLVNIPAFGWGH